MKLKKRLPDSFGSRTVCVSTSAYRRYWYKSLSALHDDLLSVVDRWVTPGMTVWDVGANCGLFTFPAAIRSGPSGQVFAFEPDLNCVKLIEESLSFRLRQESRVVLCPWAVADRSGIVSFELSAYRSAANSLVGYGRFAKGGRRVDVPAFSLDSLLGPLPSPDLVKVDVEGAEHLVLRGATSLFRDVRPTLVIEISGGEVGEETEDFLRSHAYAWRPACAAGGASFLEKGFPASEIVAIPKEKRTLPHPA
jgi:FkbM family methyltransferase